MNGWVKWWICLAWLATGCTAPALRSQSPEEIEPEPEVKTKLVGEVTKPYGCNYIEVKNVALITNLAPGAGEDPPPSPERAMLIREMQSRSVPHPNKILASGNVAMVMVKGMVPPGAQRGDKFDLEVRVPARSETTSLRNGFLMETRLSEMALIANELHEGNLMAKGEGAVLIDPTVDSEHSGPQMVNGRVLGGGTVVRSRPLGLVLTPENKSVFLSSQIGNAINRRFHSFVSGVQKGVATPKTDEFIELRIHPRYKDNIARYIRVIQSVPVRESPAEEQERLSLLQRQLFDHITSARAALRLEAMGKPGIAVLKKGLESDEAEIRFYSAEALAYLDQLDAVKPLAQIARDESAFRVYALAALSAMEDVAAYDELRQLLDGDSAETRYGAFRAIWATRPTDSMIRGENLGGQFSYHVVYSAGTPMVHVTRTFRPEIVLFGEDQRFQSPLVLDAGKSIMVKSQDEDQIVVSKFALGQPDEKRVVTSRVDDVIHAIVELGGTYPDVVQALQQAKDNHALISRLEVDAIPDGDRIYQQRDQVDEEPTPGRLEIANPVPDLFERDHTRRK